MGLIHAAGGFAVAGAAGGDWRAGVGVVDGCVLEAQVAVGQVQRAVLGQFPVGADRELVAVAVRQGGVGQLWAAHGRLVVGDAGAQQDVFVVAIVAAQRDAVGVFPLLADAFGAFGRRRELDVEVVQARAAAPGHVGHRGPFAVDLVEHVGRQGFRRAQVDFRPGVDFTGCLGDERVDGGVAGHTREVPDGVALELVRDRRAVRQAEAGRLVHLVQVTQVEADAPIVAIHRSVAILGAQQCRAGRLGRRQALGLGDAGQEGA